MFYATRMKDARGSYFKLLDGYTQLREGMVNGGGSGDNLSFGRDALLRVRTREACPYQKPTRATGPGYIKTLTKETTLARRLARRPARG
jgi:hypothetical protein